MLPCTSRIYQMEMWRWNENQSLTSLELQSAWNLFSSYFLERQHCIYLSDRAFSLIARTLFFQGDKLKHEEDPIVYLFPIIKMPAKPIVSKAVKTLP